jgi:hypothetical protein
MVGDNTVAVGTASAGISTITIQDAKATKFNIAITAGASKAFFTTLGATLKIAPGRFGAQTFILGGGVPPYYAVSEVPSAVSVSVNGSVLTVTALESAGSVGTPITSAVTLTDSTVATPTTPKLILTSVVTVGAIPLAVVPTSVTEVRVGDVLRAIITGGTPPYRAFSSVDDSIIAVKIVNANQLQVVVGQQFGSNVKVVAIVDANNVAVEFSINAGASIISNALRVSPETMEVPESTSTPNLVISVFGVTSTSDTLQVFSSDPTYLRPGTPVKNAAGTGFDIPLTGGNTCSATVTEGSVEVASVVGVDANGDGDFLDAGDTKPVAFQAAVPATGGDRIIKITVVDGKGSQGKSTITIKDNNGIGGC